MWGPLRKSPTAAFVFTMLNCLACVTLVATTIMWFYFAEQIAGSRIDKSYDMTVSAGPGVDAPGWRYWELVKKFAVRDQQLQDARDRNGGNMRRDGEFLSEMGRDGLHWVQRKAEVVQIRVCNLLMQTQKKWELLLARQSRFQLLHLLAKAR